jgi:uracil-DNA glycosylase
MVAKYKVQEPVKLMYGGDKPRIMVIGAAPRAEEVLAGVPFAAQVNYFLRSVMSGVGMEWEDCAFTYLFQHKAPADDLKYFFANKLTTNRLKKEGWTPKYPPQSRGYLIESKELEMERLAKEIDEVNPNVIIALGVDVMWALTGLTKIGTYRGTVVETWEHMETSRPYKVVSTYAIESVLFGMYDNKPIMAADFAKALAEASFPEIRHIIREAWIEPNLKDLTDFYETYIKPLKGTEQPLAFDIETMQKWDKETNEHYTTLTCLGFAPSPYVSITIPFYSSDYGGNYWTTLDQELHAWDFVRMVLEDSEIKKLTHNAIYDISWMVHHAGIKVMGIIEDTMHMHHAMQPELPKGLGILGSIYTNESAWKTMHKKSNKRDE